MSNDLIVKDVWNDELTISWDHQELLLTANDGDAEAQMSFGVDGAVKVRDEINRFINQYDLEPAPHPGVKIKAKAKVRKMIEKTLDNPNPHPRDSVEFAAFEFGRHTRLGVLDDVLVELKA